MRGFPKKYNSQKSTFFESGKRDYFQFFNKINVLKRCKSDFAIFSSFTVPRSTEAEFKEFEQRLKFKPRL